MNSPVAIKPAAFRPAIFLKKWPASFVLLTGTILTMMGISEIIGGLSTTQILDLPDPILGFPFRYLMLTMGMMELFAALLCLFTDKKVLSLGLVAWLSANFIAYRIGLWSMGWQHSSGFLIVPLGLSLRNTDFIFSSVSIFLLIGGVAALWLERRTALAAEFLKISCPSCGLHVKFAIQNLGQKIPCPHCQTTITLRKPDFLKMSCFFCKEHIEFPTHAVGQKIKCPHCTNDITLKEPVMI